MSDDVQIAPTPENVPANEPVVPIEPIVEPEEVPKEE